MKTLSIDALAESVETAMDGIWDREHSSFTETMEPKSPATKGDVIELMQEIVSELRMRDECGPE